MPYPLNNAVTADAYADAATVVFPRPTNSMTVQVFNAGVMYRLLLVPKDSLQTSGNTPDVVEHFIAPNNASFNEGDLPSGQAFAGIQFRSNAPGVPATVTVI